MSAGVISFLFAIGASTWIYTKFQRYTGNNTQTSVIASGAAGIMIFIIFYSVYKMLVK